MTKGSEKHLNARERTKALVESAMLSIIAVIFAIAGFYIPFLSFFLIFIPVPFIIVAVRNNLKYTMLAVTSASLIIASFSSPLVGIYIALISGINASVMGSMIKQGRNVRSIIIAGSAASLIATLLTFTVSTYIMGVNALFQMEEVFTNVVEQQKSFLGDGGGSAEIIRSLEIMKNTMLTLIPSSLIFGSIASAHVNYLVSGIILKRTGFKFQPLGKFSRFSLPRNIMMGLFLIITLSYVADKMDVVNGQALFLNVFYLFQIAFLLQGLSVIVFFMEKYKLPKFFRMIACVLFLLVPSFSIMAAILGILDSIINIRRMELKES